MKKKTLFSLVCLLLAMVLAVSGMVVLANPREKNVTRTPVDEAKMETAASVESAHLFSAKPQTLFQDGLIELQFDPQTFGVAVRETTMDHVWHSLPEKTGAVFTATVAKGADRLILNSQDNGVALNTVSYTADQKKKKLTVDYILAENSKAAQLEQERLEALEKKKEVSGYEDKSYAAFPVRVTYQLQDGSLFVSLDCSRVTRHGSVQLLSLSLLPDFGGSSLPKQDGFLLIPDGSGALLDLNQEVGSFRSVSLPVYGGDAAVQPGTSSCLLPAFGVRSGTSAFAAIIREGDAAASIEARRAQREAEGSKNQVYPTFTVTPNSREKVKKGDQSYYKDTVASAPNLEKAQVCYRFLSESNASYGGIAVSCREQWIRDGLLTDVDTLPEEDALPFCLTLVGKAEVTQKVGFAWFKTKKSLTTFEQAEDLVQQLRGKGVNNIRIRYAGALTGNHSPRLSLGGRLGWNRLYKAVSAQKLSLYPDVSLAQGQPSLFGTGRAKGLNGLPLESAEDALVQGDGHGKKTSAYRNDSVLKRQAADLLKKMNRLSASGVCMEDVGKVLYSDFSKSGMDAREQKEAMGEQLLPFAVRRQVMVDTGNLYALKAACAVTDMPLSASWENETLGVASIPFAQMVFHGLLDYAGTPANLAEDQKAAMLRCVEYGANPNFEWSYKDPSKYNEENAPLYYANTISEATDFYIKANAALYSVRGARIAEHAQVQPGVYCTTYDTKESVYVNYNKEEANVNGIVIPAQDFLKI